VEEDKLSRDEQEAAARRIDRLETAAALQQHVTAVLSQSDSDPYVVLPVRVPGWSQAPAAKPADSESASRPNEGVGTAPAAWRNGTQVTSPSGSAPGEALPRQYPTLPTPQS
jgi:hypothetical protein